MSIKVFWQLPVQGDSRTTQLASATRGDFSGLPEPEAVFARTGAPRDGYTYFDYLALVTGAANLSRFDGVWIPQSEGGEEPLISAGAFAREAQHLHFVASLRAPLLSAVYAAKIANSFQRLSGSRLAWYLHNEPDRADTWHGRHWSLSEQIERTGEFLDLVKGFWADEPFDYEGQHYLVKDGGFPPALQGERLPDIYLSGDTDEALALSARHGDVHVLDLAPVPVLREKIQQLTRLAAQQGRTLRFAVRALAVARETRELAWQDFETALSGGGAEPGAGEKATQNIWLGGIGLEFQGALVGGYDDILGLLGELIDAGVSEFVLCSVPALEEVYRFAEKILPHLRVLARGVSGESQLLDGTHG